MSRISRCQEAGRPSREPPPRAAVEALSAAGGN